MARKICEGLFRSYLKSWSQCQYQRTWCWKISIDPYCC